MENSIINYFLELPNLGYVVVSLFWQPRYIEFYFIIITLSKITPLFLQLINKSVLECKLIDSLFQSMAASFAASHWDSLILINFFFSESYQNNYFSGFCLCLLINATPIWPGLEKATISGSTTDDCWFWISYLQIQQFLRFNLTTVYQQTESPWHNVRMVFPLWGYFSHTDMTCRFLMPQQIDLLDASIPLEKTSWFTLGLRQL